ncbi:MAG: 5-formyltetrahydrofolate cyclo-ligase [Lachnospiraceae bacterium]|nr:5-formyltetrahydrofolate cyclo-ligase [Lachnospiraceae bacterium]
MCDTRAEKRALRKKILEIRDNIPSELIDKKSAVIWTKLMSSEAYKNASVIYFFVGYGSEVQTAPMIREALQMGKRVAVPRVVSKTDMKFCEIHALTDLVEGFKGILEPTEDAPVIKAPADLVILPGVAFDTDRNRMGYGRGYYDRFLEAIDKDVPKIALCFNEQIVDEVPHEVTDIKADQILTD